VFGSSTASPSAIAAVFEGAVGRDRRISHFPVSICHFSFGATRRMENEKWQMEIGDWLAFASSS
jgi:hypothetical protein